MSVPCGLGFYDGSLGAGSWTLALVALDATGQAKEPAATGLSARPDGYGEPGRDPGRRARRADPGVTLTPLPQCRDGVDNDLDGRVDLDDPDCAGNPDLPHRMRRDGRPVLQQ